jgi:hypothetical protein
MTLIAVRAKSDANSGANTSRISLIPLTQPNIIVPVYVARRRSTKLYRMVSREHPEAMVFFTLFVIGLLALSNLRLFTLSNLRLLVVSNFRLLALSNLRLLLLTKLRLLVLSSLRLLALSNLRQVSAQLACHGHQYYHSIWRALAGQA